MEIRPYARLTHNRFSLQSEKEISMIKEMIIRNRSYRRFFQDHPVTIETLQELVNLARMSASSRNLQPLKYLLSADPVKNALIFRHLAWAGYLKDWDGPKEGERPSAYIVMLGDTEISNSFAVDTGITSQSILLGATEMGLGGCIIFSVQRQALQAELNIPSRYELVCVLAIGKPNEKSVIVPLRSPGDIKYWRDADSVHYVPKRALEEIIIG
jgi:nitroreductase